jgi:predicted DsbA family dithiol-disulfide isomerase
MGHFQTVARLIPIAHDFTCGWCYIGQFQAQQLQRDFGIDIEWRGYELYPEPMPFDSPGAAPPPPEPVDKPKTPTRFRLALAAQGIELPKVARPKDLRTHNAHEAVELAKRGGKADEAVYRIYHAYWHDGKDIGEADVLRQLLSDLLDGDELLEVIAQRTFADQIVPFDEPAYATGVYNLPTFWIGGERFAEQPYRVLEAAMEASIKE